MSKGWSLHVGLNAVSPLHYGGWEGSLNACEEDAAEMAEIARYRGFVRTEVLLTDQATRQKITSQIKEAAAALISEDVYFLSYSGHGGQIPDLNGDEVDTFDETWCLYDAQLIDDEIFQLLSLFADGVRIIVLSDSCHSGTAIKEVLYQLVYNAHNPKSAIKYRNMPLDVARKCYKINRAFYDGILQDPNIGKSLETVRASTLLISACQDNQLAADGFINGAFTGALLKVWREGAFEGDYNEFYKEIQRKMVTPDQSPNKFTVGPQSETFMLQAPFSI